MNRTEELTLKLLDGEITDEEFKELDLLVASDGEAAACHAALLEQEALLRGDKKGIEITEATLGRIRETLVHRIEGNVLAEIRKKRRFEKIGIASNDAEPIEPGMGWLRSRRFLGAAAALLVAATIVIVILVRDLVVPHVQPQEALLFGSFEIAPGELSAFRLLVRNGRTAAPIARAGVRMALLSDTGQSAWTFETTTDSNGIARADHRIPGDLVEGGYTLQVDASSRDGESTIAQPVLVKRRFRIMVTADKPYYQPGQTIYVRALALCLSDMKPAAGRELSIEVTDPKGNKVFRKRGTASDYGMASADFELADQVNNGVYTIAAALGDCRSERSVTVKPYTLPRFRIDISTDRSFYLPGQTIRGEVTARYTFGRSVARGVVKVTASEFLDRNRPLAAASGILDEEGRFLFEIPLEESYFGLDIKKGDASLSLTAVITDTVGREEERSIERIVTDQPIRIEMIPESGVLVPGLENDLYIFTSYPDGRPARTSLSVFPADQLVDEVKVETSAMGIAVVPIYPFGLQHQDIRVTARDSAGLRGDVALSLPLGRRQDLFLLKTDRTVYEAGQTAWVEALSPSPSGLIHLDVIRNGQTVLMKTLELNMGRAHVELDLPLDLFGTLRLNAYRVLPGGSMASDSKIIQVNAPGALTITAEGDRETYRPAEEATIDFSVTGPDGKPVQAALGLSAVDEAVFALTEMRPGLEGLYFSLQEEILKPRIEMHAALPAAARKALVPGPGKEEAPSGIEEARAVLFAAAARDVDVEPALSTTYAENVEKANRERDEFFRKLAALVALLPTALFFLFTLPVLLYAFFRPLRRRRIKGFTAREAASIREKANGLAFWWGLGIWIPTMILLFGVLWDGFVPFAWYTHLFYFFLTVGLVTMQVVWVKRLFAIDATRLAPVFRKCAALLPAAYSCGYIAVFMLFAAALSSENPLNGMAVVRILGLMWFLATLATGAVSVAGGTLLEPVPASQWSFGAIGRTILAGAPGIVLMTLYLATTMGMGGEKLAGIGYLDDLAHGKDRGQMESEMPSAEMKRGKERSTARVRRYFPETLFWVPELITDEKGKARLTVPLADSITTWRVAMSAVSARGELGAGEMPLRVFQDFFVEMDCPAALTRNDTVDLPVTVFNYLDREQAVRLKLESAPGIKIEESGAKTVTIGPNSVSGVHFRITALEPGRRRLLVKARGSDMSDAIERRFDVEPDGRPVVLARSGILDDSSNRSVEHAVIVPEHAVDGGRDLLVKIYPGTFSQVVEGLDSIFRMPHGCFEQTTSVTYPNILALAYMRATGRIVPEIEMKALEFINLGYQRLLTFEVAGGGFEWYGNPPADPVLTAYGLMEFTDMSGIVDVDAALIGRTRRWLASRQLDDGSWEFSSRRVRHDTSVDGDIALRTTAYVAWALAGAGEEGETVAGALDFIQSRASGTEDPYTLALCANALLAGGKENEARKVLAWLDGMKQKEKGRVFWKSSTRGVTFSQGPSLDIEATALAALAFLEAGFGTADAHEALTWLVEQKDPAGTWHTTQTTVHVMRALLLGTNPAASTTEPLRVTVAVNGEVAEKLVIPPGDQDLLRLVPLGRLMQDGRNTVSIDMNGRGALAYQIKSTHFEPWDRPDSEAPEQLSIDVAYDTRSLRRDDRLTLSVTVTCRRPGSAAMTIVDLGIPPGFALIPETLELLKKNGLVENYSSTPRQVILYCREIENGKPITFDLGLRALFPVRVKTPPSSVYPYYEPELRDEAEPVDLVVR